MNYYKQNIFSSFSLVIRNVWEKLVFNPIKSIMYLVSTKCHPLGIKTKQVIPGDNHSNLGSATVFC